MPGPAPRSLLIRRRRPIGEDAARGPIIDGTWGAGRIVQALGELGIDLDTGGAGIRQLVVDPSTSADEIDLLGESRKFAVVVLGSHLVNRPEADVRAALLGLAVRHLAPGGELLIEHHPIDWAETAAEVRPVPGGGLGMVDVRLDPPFVSAVSVYDVGGRVVRQPFRARVVSDAELVAACAAVGLAVIDRLGPTWLRARGATSPGP